MAAGRNRESPEEGLTMLKFWVMFIVGLVVVLSLFRGFMGGVENAKLKEVELKKKMKKRGGKRKSGAEVETYSKHEHRD